MNTYKHVAAATLFAAMCLASCVSDPLDEEQYFNLVCLMDAGEEGVEYGSEDEIFISAYCGGTHAPGSDVAVTVGEASDVNIDDYNLRNVLDGETPYEALPKEWYELPSYTGVIKAGERYVRIPIRIDADRIDADKLYLLPMKIIKSTPCPISANADSVVLIKLKMVNAFSGTYTMTGKETPVNEDGTLDHAAEMSINITRTLTATSKNTVRMFERTSDEESSGLGDNGIVLTVGSDGKSVTVSPCDKLQVVEGSGKGSFKVVEETNGTRNRSFNIEYDYINANGKRMRVNVTLDSSE